MKQKAIIFGAGPAGLTAAYELASRTEVKPIIFEAAGDIGGLSKTINYQGNLIDIGGHRFFSKSDRIMQWWRTILPIQGAPSKDDLILERNLRFSKLPNAPDPEKTDKVLLIRNRLSRIFFQRRFFDYPISLNRNTFFNLGAYRICKIGLSYLKSRIWPANTEKTLEDFMVNRFGRELYLTFFKDYTEKVWGIPPSQIKPEWGAQRIKGLSVSKVLFNAFRNIFAKGNLITSKNIETSLIEEFLYPKFGPGQLWEEVSELIRRKGGEIHLNHAVIGLTYRNKLISEVTVKNQCSGEIFTLPGNYFFSSMPVRDLIVSLGASVPREVQEVAQGLEYRDFITTGLLLKKMKLLNETKIKTINNLIPDNWIYIQERDVKVGRLQIFNNWSPYMVKDPNTVWVGLEYFCKEGDKLWNKSDTDFREFAVDELFKIGMIDREDVLDSVVIRMAKAYPAYFGAYEHFNVIKNFIDRFTNLFLIGRNGMHRYNNQDHSMLTAMAAVENIINKSDSKENIWNINTEEAYHENKSA